MPPFYTGKQKIVDTGGPCPIAFKQEIRYRGIPRTVVDKLSKSLKQVNSPLKRILG